MRPRGSRLCLIAMNLPGRGKSAAPAAPGWRNALPLFRPRLLHQVPEAMPLHRSLWAGRIMSAFVVIALVADGTIQLFAPAQIASMLHETGFAMDLTRVVGPIILTCAILYAIPATAVLGAILVTGFLGGAICAHVRIGELGSPPEIISLLLGAMTWGGLYARHLRIRAILPLIR